MHPSLRVCSARAHQPLIRFLGKRTYPSTPSTPHAHPAAPAELKKRFEELFSTSEASGSAPVASSGSKVVFAEFWEAPERFWKRDIEDSEIDAILSGGASLY
ncbi:hypothetical protein Hypma_004185 [Hypsizygus marmoreus]|uniref:Uncharacterized protein n=1 Tax=Hypsizygus marmoreus TaxID=39966 RepID=A0A369J0F6_HYPMA|nr:hypothetical protein Hypma_004185 [Hypsizygus marmoreus]